MLCATRESRARVRYRRRTLISSLLIQSGTRCGKDGVSEARMPNNVTWQSHTLSVNLLPLLPSCDARLRPTPSGRRPVRYEGRAGVGGAPGSMTRACWMGSLRELLEGELVMGVRAGLGRITAYPSSAASLRSSPMLSVLVRSLVLPRVCRPIDDETNVGEAARGSPFPP